MYKIGKIDSMVEGYWLWEIYGISMGLYIIFYHIYITCFNPNFIYDKTAFYIIMVLLW